MADIRMLINTSSITIVDGLRGHLTGKSNGFGNPRPVSSWLNSNVTKRTEPALEQLLAPTMLLQQQIQESRGEIKASQNDVRPHSATSKQSIRERSVANGNGTNAIEHGTTSNTTVNYSSRNEDQQTFTSINHSKTTNPLASPVPTEIQATPTNSTEDAQTNQRDQELTNDGHFDTSVTKESEIHDEEANILAERFSEPAQNAIAAPTVLQPQALTKVQPATPADVANGSLSGTTALVSEEDVVIFQQMKHQLVVWTRIE